MTSPRSLSGVEESHAKLPTRRFVLGLDLDGVCADFYARMREVTAEWLGVDAKELTEDVSYGLPEWGVRQRLGNDPGEYERIHRFAVTQRKLFESMRPISGAPQAIRRLGTEGIRVRIISYRLFIRWFHEVAVAQTVRWLDNHAIPYWDLCLMRDKESVDADVYVEDSPENIERLRSAGRDVIVFDNSTNRRVADLPGGRARSWDDAERMVRERYYKFLQTEGCDLPAEPGRRPSWDLTL
jgi:5'(3')-deoxyribonucleotidase